MKKSFIALAAVILVIAMVGAVMAAGTNTLTVQANVLGTCKFVSTTSLIDFGSIDPTTISGTVNAPQSSTTFWCTKGTLASSPTLSVDNGVNWTGTSRAMKNSGNTDVIPYILTLTKDALTNQGPSVPRTLTINASALATDIQSASTGSYSDTVTIDINP